MQTLRDLFNQALTTVGDAPSVTDPNAASGAANICRLWFDVARHAVFCAHHWPSLRVTARLSRIATRDTAELWQDTDPAPGWAYAFSLPNNMVQPQYLVDFSRFELVRVESTMAICTNTEYPILRYTGDFASPELWAPELYRAVVFSLAAHLNMAKNGKVQITQKLEQSVHEIVTLAAVNAANSDDTYFEAVPSHWVNSGFTVPSPQSQYFYPTQTFRVAGLV